MSNREIIKSFWGGWGLGAARCMKSHFYKQYQKENHGYEACQTPDLCFCGLEGVGAQHSIAFLSF